MKNFSLFISLVFLLSACGGHVVVSSRKCKSGLAQWKKTDAPTDYDVRITRWASSTDDDEGQKVPIFAVLEENNRACNNLEDLQITIKHTFSDLLVSMMPFMNRSTIIVSGHIEKREDDFGLIKDDGNFPRDGEKF